MARVNLETFAGGALQEKFDDAMEKVLQNMTDPNTPWKNKRKITVEVTFEQNEDRDDSSVNVSVGRDLSTGKCYAEEYGNTVRGQMSFDDLQRPEDVVVDGKTVDPETGEIKDGTTQVVDFRAVKQG